MLAKEDYFMGAGYTYGAYPETSPERLAFVALLQSQRPPDLGGPFRYLELGCGQGFGLCLHAANYPQAQFVGVDLSPEHIAHGRALATSSELSNITFLLSNFCDLQEAAPEGWGQFDFVVAHGVLSYISPKQSQKLMQCAAQALRPGGLFYLSYNTLPGWLDALPFQHVTRNLKHRFGEGKGCVDAAINLFRDIQKSASPLVQAQPRLAARLDALSREDPMYLLHEYVTPQWEAKYADDVISEANDEGLIYLGSAALPESFNGLLPEGFRRLLVSCTDSKEQELLRDLLVNQNFRRDVYARGRDQHWPHHAIETIRQVEIISLMDEDDLLRPDAFTFQLGFGEIQGNRVWFLGLMKHLLQQGPCRLGDLQRKLTMTGTHTPLAELLQNLSLLLHSGAIGLLPPSRNPAPAQHFNRIVVHQVAAGAPYHAIALPRIGSLLNFKPEMLLLLHASLQDHSGAGLLEALDTNLEALGRSLLKDGHLLEGMTRREQLGQLVARFESHILPLLRRLEAVA